MGKKDLRVDAYIEKSADFAKPILKRLRKLIHAGCPQVEEAIKWGCPHFVHQGMLCSMATFKEHCTFGFWKSSLMKPLKIPTYFGLAMKRNAKARATFESLSPSHQREYIEWITDAKTDATRQKRVDTALEWLAEGKSRNWKYERR
ncbi:MAG: YdeI/OmpD-associated family protein [Planctomycetia bacterium]|nr:YdeI/OmpD-associated family protein [Planctomycetia bacterium]